MRGPVASSMALVTIGSFGYRRGLGITSQPVGDGNLLIAGEMNTYNGPWANPDDLRKLNAVMRYTQGVTDNGFSLTAMAYSNKWNSSDQIPQRAITSGQVGLYGELDPQRWRQFGPLLDIGQMGADRRRRLFQDQFLRPQELAQSLEQLHLFSDRSHQWRSISPAR